MFSASVRGRDRRRETRQRAESIRPRGVLEQAWGLVRTKRGAPAAKGRQLPRAAGPPGVPSRSLAGRSHTPACDELLARAKRRASERGVSVAQLVPRCA